MRPFPRPSLPERSLAIPPSSGTYQPALFTRRGEILLDVEGSLWHAMRSARGRLLDWPASTTANVKHNGVTVAAWIKGQDGAIHVSSVANPLSAFPAEVQATILAAIDGTSDEGADRLLPTIERALSAAIAEKP